MDPWKQSQREEQGGVTVTHQHAGFIGGRGFRSGSAVEIKNGWNYNGSGRPHFGDVDQWPTVAMRFSLPSGREELAAQLTEQLKKFAGDFLKSHGLQV